MELGLYVGESLEKVQPFVEKGFGVDMNINLQLENLKKHKNLEIVYSKTDDFFANFNNQIDMAFIDADHCYESALCDFKNVYKRLNAGGIIILHDTDPESDNLIHPTYCGDSYKMVTYLENQTDLNCTTFPLYNAGLTIVTKKNDTRTFRRMQNNAHLFSCYRKQDKFGWLVNDCLTCIPGVNTFWHNLLEWFPELIDKTNTYTDYSVLSTSIENQLLTNNKPYYIIRNGTYFPRIQTDVKQVSLIQDIVTSGNLLTQQIDVMNNSTIVVFNTNYVYAKYKQYINENIRVKVCPLGVDFDFFKPIPDTHPNVLPNSILFMGASTNYPKGFNVLLDIINKMNNSNFCLIMKDDFSIENLEPTLRNRVRVFNKINCETIRLIINSCIVCVCTLYEETQHISGIECAACNIPIVAREVGVYFDNRDDTRWGCIADDSNFAEKINYVLEHRNVYEPRNCFIEKYSNEICKTNWVDIINTL